MKTYRQRLTFRANTAALIFFTATGWRAFAMTLLMPVAPLFWLVLSFNPNARLPRS